MKNKRKKKKQAPVLKKIKLYFILFVILLWGIAAYKLFVLFDDYHFTTSSHLTDDDLFDREETKEDSPATVFFTEFIDSLYGEHYEILNLVAIPYIPEDEEFEDDDKFYFVRIEKKLKYSSVFQLPFVSGMKKAVDELNSSQAEKAYNNKANELKKYIGEKQIEYNLFKLSLLEPEDFSGATIEIATYHNKMPAERLRPLSSSAMAKDGYNFIKKAVKHNTKKIKYDNYKAVRYADKFSSNPIKTGINKDKWNDEYKPYENDCANFVSQCLYTGGVKTTSLWFPESFYWIRTGSPRYPNVSGVSDYMQKLNAFYKTSYSSVSAGGFICLNEESHVVFITSNDSITILFNGHTNDRKRISFPRMDSTEAIYLTPNN